MPYADPEVERAYKARYRAENKERRAAYQRKWWAAKKEALAPIYRARQKERNAQDMQKVWWRLVCGFRIVAKRQRRLSKIVALLLRRTPEYAEYVKARRRAAVKAYVKLNPEKRKQFRRQAKAIRRARKLGACGKLTPGILRKLFFLQRGRCVVCRTKFGKEKGSYHLDHIMPLALGGSHTDENVQLLCPSCNIAKGAKHPTEFMQAQGFLL